MYVCMYIYIYIHSMNHRCPCISHGGPSSYSRVSGIRYVSGIFSCSGLPKLGRKSVMAYNV